MATYTGTGAQATVQPKGLRVGLVAVKSTHSFGAVTLSIGDIFPMVKVPAGATPIWMNFGSSNGSVHYNIEVGDGIDTDRYRTSVATYSAALGMQVVTINSTPYTYSQDDTIDILIATATASNLSFGGTFYMNVIFSMDAT